MSNAEQTLERVQAAIKRVPAMDARAFPIAVGYVVETLTLEGEVKDIAMKKLCLEAAAAVPGVGGIVDRLRVRPGQRMGDREIRDHVRNALLGEPAFADMAFGEIDRGERRRLREPPDFRGDIAIEVHEGVVTLTGAVPGLVEKRLAGVLAWWVPGVRDVVNGLAVDPSEPESEAGLTDAVRIALEKDPFVNDGQIRVRTHKTVVTLTGLVPTESEREMAELDAWSVFGVDKVINRVEVHR
jgi:osmotically-inducible protein OsmY